MNKKLFSLLAIAFVMSLAFIIGRVSSKNNKDIFTKVNAEPFQKSEVMTSSTGVRYEKIYAYGETFVVFSNSSGSDIEVFAIQ